ncbi:MAG: FkbM family methyltransferase [Ectothiorhodospiraceae bacterium]|nr:FkbM family methyltransferase [Ectothiorhodospiraceae bacterium]
MRGGARLHGRLAAGGPWHGQFGQDRYLDTRVFRGRRDGVFVEAGAYDGVTGSNTVFFERVRGWRGLLIEPCADLAAKARLARAGPVLEVALAPLAGRGRFIDVRAGYRMMSGLEDSYSETLLRAVRANAGHEERLIEVPTRPLESVLDEAGLVRIDLVSLDIEGAEMAVLGQFPFERFDIDAWCIENHTHGPDLPSLMARHGYRQAALLGVDEIYVREATRERRDG